MNFFENDGMHKIGNVELKFIADRDGNGDMLIYKTAKGCGSVFLKAVPGCYVRDNEVVIMTGHNLGINIGCDNSETAIEVANMVTSILLMLYASNTVGTFRLEKLGNAFAVQKNTECSCGGKCDCDEKDIEEKLSGFFSAMTKAMKDMK